VLCDMNNGYARHRDVARESCLAFPMQLHDIKTSLGNSLKGGGGGGGGKKARCNGQASPDRAI
jgi:hypothetical protein